MNEHIPTQLKVLVERIVRPVRATASRKRKMREELLAHVCTVFEEEVKAADPSAALERTGVRLGNAAQLTAELQATVSKSDAAEGALERFLYTPGDSMLRRASRHAWRIAAGILVLLPFIWLARGRAGRWPTDLFLQGSVFLAICWVIFAYTFLTHWLGQSLFGPSGRSWFRAGLVFAAAWLLLPACGAALRLTFGDDGWSILRDALWTLPFFVVIPAILIVLGHESAAQLRDQQEWGSLELDSSNGE